MNPYGNANQIYRSRSVAAASPADQVAMLLEKAAFHMATARDAMENKDYEARYLATEKAQTIINGLQQCLNVDDPNAKAMVDVFDNYYTSMMMMITRVNVKNDRRACDVVIDGLKEMAGTWRQVGQKVSGGGTPPRSSPQGNSGPGYGSPPAGGGMIISA